MLGSNANVGVSCQYTNLINIDVITQIEKDLEPNDVVSMVFLLYDIPQEALKRLIVFESLSKDDDKNLDILKDWALQAQQQRRTWKDEFLEALAICQLYRVISNLGIPVEVVKKCFVPDYLQISIYVDPMKKLLYKLCENMTTDNLEKLQISLKTYNLDIRLYKFCEMIFLELVLKSFIIIKINKSRIASNLYQTENLAKIVEKLPGLERFSKAMRQLENSFNTASASTSDTSTSRNTIADEPKENSDDDKYVKNAFNNLSKQMTGLAMKDEVASSSQNNTVKNKKLPPDAYCIKNPRRVGVCYIINQEKFKDVKNMQGVSGNNKLDARLGSNKDKIVLEKTMASLNFEVIAHRNLDHENMIEFIRNIVQFRVQYDDSMFMLCILSHGVKDHVYAADSVKVSVEDIQNLLDEEFQQRQLYEIPKIIIIQACQVENNVPHPTLVADSPSKYYMRKSHFLTYWATAPELEAFRDEKSGSIFIQFLCFIVQKYASKDHLQNIFTMVNATVTHICKKLQRVQVPLFKSTLTKKLYLQIPDVL